MNTRMEEATKAQSQPTSPLNLVSIDEITTEELTAGHPDARESTLDMNTMVKRLDDPKSVTVLASITG